MVLVEKLYVPLERVEIISEYIITKIKIYEI